MFFVVISRVKDKVLLFMRLVLVVCILFILVAQLYGMFKTGGFVRSWFDDEQPVKDSVPVEEHLLQ
ncbi:hypothetical protein [Desulfoscipio geothermicus]|uniref:Uncharacterized protein n=1 Tax=Desulfoscipio geothermicus DSM 3669 TaxID=1121426 RepID=A0A1I6DAK9_9FIRM|nr:hypothetical protein [Desulfoscipio geothermicus]SFR02474.1 hypothetical protein SAMN05660706_1089 [Desulfoscipio geothermicus DSM 3669]